jgi:hypothetical protein
VAKEELGGKETMDPTNFVIWIFLGIFVVTALIVLGALVGWVPLESYYKKKLFVLLILEVVACIIAFGTQAIRQITHPSPQTDLRTVLLSSELGWDWQYAENGWRAHFQFQRVEENKFVMVGSTYQVDKGGQSQLIIKWESSEPFDVPANAKAVTFKAQRIWTKAAAETYPKSHPEEVDKKIDILITVHLEIYLKGAAKNVATEETWGLEMTPAFK